MKTKHDMTKAEALKVLKEAMDQVNRTVKAIEDYAAAYSLGHIIDSEGHVTLDEFTDLVAERSGLDEGLVFCVLAEAFSIMKDLELTVCGDDEDEE